MPRAAAAQVDTVNPSEPRSSGWLSLAVVMSYKDMGAATLLCVGGGCNCTAQTIDALWTAKLSIKARLAVHTASVSVKRPGGRGRARQAAPPTAAWTRRPRQDALWHTLLANQRRCMIDGLAWKPPPAAYRCMSAVCPVGLPHARA